MSEEAKQEQEEQVDIHAKMRAAVQAEMNGVPEPEEGIEEESVDEGYEQDSDVEPQYTQTELEALDIGWNPEGKDKDGNTLSAEEFLARKPLFNKIKNMHDKMDEMDKVIRELREDNKKIAQAGIKEKQELLQELKEAREKALDDLDADEVRSLDKRIENVQGEIKEDPKEPEQTEYVSPHWEPFLKDNEWAKDTDSAMYHAGMGIARQFLLLHPEYAEPGKDGPVYEHLHKRIREEFPEKFKVQTKSSASKVASSNKRATSGYSKKKQVTLADLPEDEREVVRVMMRATGKTEEEYLKNYEL